MNRKKGRDRLPISRPVQDEQKVKESQLKKSLEFTIPMSRFLGTSPSDWTIVDCPDAAAAGYVISWKKYHKNLFQVRARVLSSDHTLKITRIEVVWKKKQVKGVVYSNKNRMRHEQLISMQDHIDHIVITHL